MTTQLGSAKRQLEYSSRSAGEANIGLTVAMIGTECARNTVADTPSPCPDAHGRSGSQPGGPKRMTKDDGDQPSDHGEIDASKVIKGYTFRTAEGRSPSPPGHARVEALVIRIDKVPAPLRPGVGWHPDYAVFDAPKVEKSEDGGTTFTGLNGDVIENTRFEGLVDELSEKRHRGGTETAPVMLTDVNPTNFVPSVGRDLNRSVFDPLRITNDNIPTAGYRAVHSLENCRLRPLQKSKKVKVRSPREALTLEDAGGSSSMTSTEFL